MGGMVDAEPLTEHGRGNREAGNAKFDSLNVKFVGNWPFGASQAVAYDASRHLVFSGSGGGVYILNVLEHSSPIRVSDIRTRGVVRDLFYDASYILQMAMLDWRYGMLATLPQQ